MNATTISIGDTGRIELTVEERHCTRRGDYQIFSTPNMVMLLEMAAIEALRPRLPEGMMSVGTKVDVKHLAPTPLGMRVFAEAQVTVVEGQKVSFVVKIFDQIEQVGEAVHERFVLDLERYMRRLAKKMQSAGAEGAAKS
jgi:predicted thioesterase